MNNKWNQNITEMEPGVSKWNQNGAQIEPVAPKGKPKWDKRNIVLAR